MTTATETKPYLFTDITEVQLRDHGTFASTPAGCERANGYTKRQLAQLIAEAYGGGCGKASTKSYWLTFPYAVLVVVYAGLVEPDDRPRPTHAHVTVIGAQRPIVIVWGASRREALDEAQRKLDAFRSGPHDSLLPESFELRLFDARDGHLVLFTTIR